MSVCTIYLNDKPYDVGRRYIELHPGALFPATPTMTICDLAYASGFANAKPCYRKNGSRVTDQDDWCVVETDKQGNYIGPVYTVVKDCNRALPLCDGKRFATFPEGYY